MHKLSSQCSRRATSNWSSDFRKEVFHRLAPGDTRQKTAHDLRNELGSSAFVSHLRLGPRFRPVHWHSDIKVCAQGSNDIRAFPFSAVHCLL
jgi:hypothetical protein